MVAELGGAGEPRQLVGDALPPGPQLVPQAAQERGGRVADARAVVLDAAVDLSRDTGEPGIDRVQQAREERCRGAPAIVSATERRSAAVNDPPRSARSASVRMSAPPWSDGATPVPSRTTASAVRAWRTVTSAAWGEGTSPRASAAPCGVTVASASRSTISGYSRTASDCRSMRPVYERAQPAMCGRRKWNQALRRLRYSAGQRTSRACGITSARPAYFFGLEP